MWVNLEVRRMEYARHIIFSPKKYSHIGEINIITRLQNHKEPFPNAMWDIELEEMASSPIKTASKVFLVLVGESPFCVLHSISLTPPRLCATTEGHVYLQASAYKTSEVASWPSAAPHLLQFPLETFHSNPGQSCNPLKPPFRVWKYRRRFIFCVIEESDKTPAVAWRVTECIKSSCTSRLYPNLVVDLNVFPPVDVVFLDRLLIGTLKVRFTESIFSTWPYRSSLWSACPNMLLQVCLASTKTPRSPSLFRTFRKTNGFLLLFSNVTWFWSASEYVLCIFSSKYLGDFFELTVTTLDTFLWQIINLHTYYVYDKGKWDISFAQRR